MEDPLLHPPLLHPSICLQDFVGDSRPPSGLFWSDTLSSKPSKAVPAAATVNPLRWRGGAMVVWVVWGWQKTPMNLYINNENNVGINKWLRRGKVEKKCFCLMWNGMVFQVCFVLTYYRILLKYSFMKLNFEPPISFACNSWTNTTAPPIGSIRTDRISIYLHL